LGADRIDEIYNAQVGRLMESYLAEIATDPNLSIDKFVGLAELIPEQAKFNEDGMYRAIDIYLKVVCCILFNK
jgi:NPH3 family